MKNITVPGMVRLMVRAPFSSPSDKNDDVDELAFARILSCARHTRGRFTMGMLYQRGDIWWIKYYRNGKYFRESTKTSKKMVAQKILNRREGEIAEGKAPSVEFERVSFDSLAQGIIQDYKINGKKSLVRAERSVRHLGSYFGGMKAVQISTPSINNYILKRLGSGAANASINRELSALKRMLNLGAKQTPPLVNRVPHIPMLKENNIRKGFFEHDGFLALRDALPSYIRGLVTFAYKTGWRDTEISSLTWRQVDMKQGIVCLNVGETKNDDGRTVFLDEELKAIFREQFLNRNLGCQYVFAHDGQRIKDFRVAWNKACRETGLGYGYKTDKKYVEEWKNRLAAGPIMHDFRRTAVRNILRSGVSERVAMMISGHKTRSVFDRYNIVSLHDLKEAARKQESYLNILTAGTARAQYGHIMGTIG